MITTILIYYILPVLLLIKLINYLVTNNQILSASNEILKLEKKLMFLRLKEDSRVNEKAFDFVQRCIENAQKTLPSLNIYSIIYQAFKKRDQQGFTQLNNLEYSLSRHAELNEIYHDFTAIIVHSLISKNRFTLSFIKIFWPAIKWGYRTFHPKNMNKFISSCSNLIVKVKKLVIIREASGLTNNYYDIC